MDHALHLIVADFEGVGHGPQPRRIDNKIPIFDGRPLGGLHTGQLSGFFDGTADERTDIVDHDAEQPR
jgi:hypothetical protein